VVFYHQRWTTIGHVVQETARLARRPAHALQ
jgi:hypothetical protein